MNLTNEQKQEAKELLTKLENLYKDRVNLDILKIDRETNLKSEIASICDIKDKKGEIQPSKVKMPLVSALIDELFLEKNNKKEEEYVIMNTYRSAISNGVNKSVINAYVALKESFDENNQNIKEAFKETSILDKDILEAVNFIAKEYYKTLLENAKLEIGIETKPSKDMSMVLELIEELKKILK